MATAPTASPFPPAFRQTACLSLVDRGFVYAIAHIRGGEEKGRSWYLAWPARHQERIRLRISFRKCRTISSMQKFTSKGQIIAQGGSAGGMLMGVAANWAGDLFGGIIAEVPFVDVLEHHARRYASR